MKFGMFVNSQQPRSEDPVKRFREVVEQGFRTLNGSSYPVAAVASHLDAYKEEF